jgi:O-antigen/teichoic acid export membrane protein/O-antigen ligase
MAGEPEAPLRPPAGRSLIPGIGVAAVGGTIGARLVATFLSFVAGIIAARELGAHGRGLLALLIAVPAAISVLGVVGLDTANLRFAGRSHTAFLQIVRRAVVFSMAAGTAISGAWWLASSRWPVVRLGLSPRLALLCALVCPIAVLLTLLGAAEVGRGRTYTYNLVTAITMAVYLGAIAVLAAGGHLTVVRCFVWYEVSQGLGIAAFLVLAGRRVHEDGEKVPLREYRSYCLRAYLPNIAQYGMLRMDVPLVQVLAGTKAVAMYAVALPFAEGMLLVPVAVSLVMFPRVTSGEISRRAALQITRTVLVSVAALAAAVAVSVPAVVPAVYGTAFRGSIAVIWCMLPGVVIFSAGRTVQTYLAATDRLRPVITASVAGVAIGLVSLIVLTPRFGAAGAGAADSAGYLAYAVVLTGCLRRDGLVVGSAAAVTRRCRRGALAIRTAAAGMSRLTVLAWVVTIAAALAAAGLSTVRTATVLTVIGMVIIVMVIAVPSAGIYLLAIAIPVSQTSRGATFIAVKDLLALVIACLLGRIAAGHVDRPRARIVAAAGALVVYFLLSVTLVGGRDPSTQDLLNVVELAVPLLCLPLIVRADSTSRRALSAFSYSAACLALVEVVTSRASLAASVNLSAVTSTAVAAGRTGALDHNVEGALFVLALCVLLARFPGARRGMAKLAIAVAIAAVLAGVAYSFSRASYFGALAVLFAFAMRRPVRGIIGTAIAAAILLPLAPAAVLARIGTIWNSSGLDVSSAVRLDLWSSAARMFAHSPVLGIGYLNFADQLPAYFSSTGNYATATLQLSALVYVHNTYLTVLAETGIIGGVMVGALIVAGWRKAWPAARSGDEAGLSAVLAFVGLGVCSMFGEPLFAPALLAAFLLVVLAAGRPKGVPGGVAAETGTASAMPASAIAGSAIAGSSIEAAIAPAASAMAASDA